MEQTPCAGSKADPAFSPAPAVRPRPGRTLLRGYEEAINLKASGNYFARITVLSAVGNTAGTGMVTDPVAAHWQARSVIRLDPAH
jgi:hypothetical protein